METTPTTTKQPTPWWKGPRVALAAAAAIVVVAVATFAIASLIDSDEPDAIGEDSVARIAFQSGRDGKAEVYVMDADGSNQTRLTDNPASDTVPAWSPDGTKIAFQSGRDGNNEVYVMDADGSNQTRLTNNPAGNTVPAWSPVG